MNIYDKANELADALKECPEVITLREAAEKIKKNDANKNMVKDFRKLQYEAYSEQVKNGELSKNMEDKLNKIGTVISMNPDVSAYLQAESRFAMIWEDIMKALNEAVNVDIGFEFEK